MTELAPYVAPQQISRDVVDGWTFMLDSTAKLAREIAPTDFVPKALRGNAAAVAACILAGRELGLGPMASLQNLFVIEGTPALRAQMMRALVLAHGHSYRIAEWTAQRCVMWGTRAGGQEQGPAEFTMDMARAAHLDRKPVWQAYPADMLLARATGRLCRAVFPDALAGMSYTAEELADMDAGSVATIMPMAPTPMIPTAEQGTTVQREQRPEQPQAGAPSSPSQPVAQASEVELEGDTPAPERPRSSEATRQAAIARAKAERAPQAAPEPEPAPADGAASPEQGRMIHALLGELYPDGQERDERIQLVQGLLSRRVQSFSELTGREAGQLIDTLSLVRDSQDPQGWLQHMSDEGHRALELVESGAEEQNAEILEGRWEGPDES